MEFFWKYCNCKVRRLFDEGRQLVVPFIQVVFFVPFASYAQVFLLTSMVKIDSHRQRCCLREPIPPALTQCIGFETSGRASARLVIQDAQVESAVVKPLQFGNPAFYQTEINFDFDPKLMGHDSPLMSDVRDAHCRGWSRLSRLC